MHSGGGRSRLQAREQGWRRRCLPICPTRQHWLASESRSPRPYAISVGLMSDLSLLHKEGIGGKVCLFADNTPLQMMIRSTFLHQTPLQIPGILSRAGSPQSARLRRALVGSHLHLAACCRLCAVLLMG